MANDVTKIGLLFNTQKPAAIEMAWRLWNWGREEGVSFLFPPHEASAISIPGVDDETWRREASFAVILGGDGTFLRAARYTFGTCDTALRHKSRPPRLSRDRQPGIGRRGHQIHNSADITRSSAATLLKGQVWRSGRFVHELHALNDFVISKGSIARVTDLEVKVGGETLTLFLADGLILSTPTGSTAYALSAGGPIVPPHVPCMIVAPICAHTLYARPVILSGEDRAVVIPKGDARSLMLTQDGQLGYELLPGDELHAMLDPDVHVQMIQLNGRSYYDLLRQKAALGVQRHKRRRRIA